MTLNEIQGLIDNGRLQEAVDRLVAFTRENARSDEAWFMLGKVYWRLGQRSKATTCYATAAEICPDSPAALALQQARDIEDFFNPDIFNP
ncbi:MAG: tetratricopeptide repeat protein [Bacteroidales bacterium]|nr:tetratricopeptide repeat protein [Bacteroidales bacterium]